MIYLIIALLYLIMHFVQNRGYFNDTQIKRIRLLLLTLIILVSGIRYKIGTDYDHYTNIFNLLKTSQGSYVEIGYQIFNYPFFLFGEIGIYVLFFVSSAVIIYSFDYFIRKNIGNKYYFLAWFFFLTTGIVFSSYNAIRQYLAIVIFIFSLKDLYIKKYFKFIAMVILSAQFHTSAYILLLLIPLRVVLSKSTKIFHRLVLLIYLLSLIFLVIDFREVLKMIWFIVPERWQWYIVSDFFNTRNFSAIVKQIVPNFLVFLLLIPNSKNLFISKPKISEIDLFRFSIFLIFVSLSNVFYGIMVLQRFIYYFEVFYVYVIVYIISTLDIKKLKTRTNLNVIKAGLVIYFVIWYFYLIFIKNAHTIYPYRSIMEVFLK